MTATDTPESPSLLGRNMVTVELARVTDNPWQPRVSLDPEQVKEIADSIREIGLLQPPLVRPWAEGWQVAFGHYRVAALRLLGYDTVELEERMLADSEMAIIALTENRKRKNVTPIEEYRAWQRALEIEGMTVTGLGTAIGLDRSTVSNNLRLLKLPQWVLQHVDAGDMSAHTAREFLCLMGSDGHFHDDVAKNVLSRMLNGVPDWRASRVRKEIDEVVCGSSVNDWRKLFKGYAGGGHNADPTFDVAKFKQDKDAQVHTLPNDEWGGDVWRDGERQPGKVTKEHTREWTCATSAWVSKQNAGKKAAEGVAAKAAPADSGPVKSGSFAKVLAADPVFATVSPETQGPLMKALAKDALESDAAEALGTRALPVLLNRGASQFKAYVGDRREDFYGNNVTPIPSYFPNIEECRAKCTIGATYGRFSESGALNLFCLNQEHFEEKVDKGRQTIMKKVERQRDVQDQADAKVRSILDGQHDWTLPPEPVMRLLATVLLSHASFNGLYPDNVGWQEKESMALLSSNTGWIGQLVGRDLQRDGHWRAEDKVTAVAALDADQVKDILMRLLVNEAAVLKHLAPAFDALAQPQLA